MDPRPLAGNELDDLLVEQTNDDRQQLQQSMTVASTGPTTPAQMAKVLPIAKRRRLPSDVVARHLQELEANDRTATADYDAIIRDTPGLAEWLRSPDNATLGRDELAALGRVDRGSRVLVKTPAPAEDLASILSRNTGLPRPIVTAAGAGLSDIQSAAGQLAAAYGLVDPTQAAAFVARQNGIARQLRELAPSYATDYREATARILAEHHAGNLSTVAEVLDLLGAAATHPRGLAYTAAEGFVPSIPALVLGMLAARAGGPVGLGAGTFAGQAPVSVGSEINAQLERRGVDIADPAALEAAYRDPAIMNAVRSAAERKGITIAAVSALTAGFGGALTSRAAGAGAGIVGKTAAKVGDVTVQVAGQGAADAAGQVAGGEPLDLGQSMQAAIAMLGQEIGTAAVGASSRSQHHADPIVAAHEAVARTGDALRAQRDAQALGEIGAAVQEATTTASVPERVKQLVELASGGEDAAQVYFQAGEWDKYWTGKGASPAKAAADIMGDGGRAYDEARTTGAPLAIALGDYIAKVATTEHFTGLLESARTRPDGMSLGEAHEYLTALPSTMRELAAEATGSDAPKDAATAIGDQVTEQVEAAGRPKTEAKAAGSIWTSFFRTMAERTGIDAQALFDRFKPQIQRGESAPPVESAAAAQNATTHEQAIVATVPEAEVRQMLASMSESGFAMGADAATVIVPHGQKVAGADDTVTMMRTAMAYAGKDVFRAAADAEIASRGAKGNVDGEKAAIEETARRIVAQGRASGELFQLAPGTVEERLAQIKERIAAGETVTEPGHDVVSIPRVAQAESQAIDLHDLIKSVKKKGTKLQVDVVPSRESLLAWLSGSSAEVALHYLERAKGNVDKALAMEAADSEAIAKVGFYFGANFTGLGTNRSGFERLASEGVGRLYSLAGRELDATHEYAPGVREGFAQAEDELFLYQKSAAGARGRIRIGPDGTAAIDLFASANRSTFLHESGHFYYHVLESLAGDAAAPAELKADHGILRDWVGAKEGDVLTRGQQEQLARGFEAYVMEGKAPSATLRSAFFRFKQWLLTLYGHATALQVELTPEVRGVFDRLLASREEIAQAEATQHARGLFDDPRAAGMSEEQAASYQAAVDAAHQAAEETLTTQLMRDLRRQDSAEWKRLRVPIEQEVTAQVANDKVYRAITELTSSFKIDRASAKELLGPAYEQLPAKVTATEAGVPPDVAAEMLGFKNGRELLVTLAHAPSEKSMVRLLTDERMRAEYGDQTTDAEIREHATAAVMGEKRAQLLRREIQQLASKDFAAFKGLTRTFTAPLPSDAAVRLEASRLVGAKPVKEITPHLYEVAAARHAREAREAFLKGDLELALALKQKELLVTEVHSAALQAKETVQKSLEGFKDVFKADAKLGKTRDMDLVNTARAVLATFGIGRSEQPPAAYLEQIRKYEPDTYDALAPILLAATETPAANGSYRSLRYDDFVAMKEAVDGLWSLSRRTRQMEIDGQLVDREQVHQELATRLEAFATPGVKAGYAKAATAWDKAKMSLLGVKAALRRVESWADAMDSTDPGGVFRKYIWNPVSEGATAYRLAKREAMAKYLEVVHGVEGTLTKTPIAAPELGYEFANKAELLGAILHSGNESNLSKLLRGRGWGTVDEFGALDRSRWDAMVKRLQQDGTLTKADYDYAQGVWDLFDDLKAGAQRAHKAMYGHYFSEITANAFETPYGEYRGGYVPAKADPFMTPDAAIRDEKSSLEGNNNSFSFPTTGRGFTKARVDAYAAPLVIDARFVPSHIDQVLRFTHIEPRVKDVARVLHDRDITSAMDNVDPTIRGDMLVPWLQRAATQKVDVPSGTGWGAKAMDTFARELRRRSGMQIIALNVVNSLQQLTGISISAVKVGPGHLQRALWQYVRAPKETAAAIAERSDYMRSRETGHVAEIQKTIDELMLDPSMYDQARTFAAKHGHFLTAATQGFVDTITWTGAYDQATAAGHADAEAVRIADSAVRETQGSGAPEDISRFETGTPFHRLFSMFTGYFNMQANLLGTEFSTTMRTLGLRKGAGRLAYVYALGFMLPAVLSDQLMQLGSGRPFDQDDDGPADDALALFFGSQFSGGLRMVPVAGPVADFATRQFITHRPDDRIATSAAIATIERAVSAPHDVYTAIRERQITTKEIRDVLTALGLLTGMPIAPLAKPLGYLNDVSSGRAQPTGPIDVGRGLMTGQPGGSR